MSICPWLLVVLSGFAANCRKPGIIAACTLALSSLGLEPARAQDATWVGSTPDFNDPANWTPAAVPIGPTGTATFGPSSMTSLAFTQDTTVDTLQFNANAPAYTFGQVANSFGSRTIEITGLGIQVDPAGAPPTFNIDRPVLDFTNSSTAGPAFLNAFNTGPIAFLDTSNAGTATITAGFASSNAVTDPDGFTGGFVFFRNSSTAASATITTHWASNIEFDDTSKAGNANITAPVNGGSIFFENASSADHATITMADGTGELSFAPEFFGGGTATAGDAIISNSGRTNFFQGSTAGDATITTDVGGVTSFFGESTGGNAALITNAGGIVDISGLGTFPDGGSGANAPGMTAGSIAGAGTYDLGSKQLTVGSNNLSTTVSGLIEDGGSSGGVGGSLVKVGTGTLTLLGNNTYTGGTTVSQGTIAVSADPGLGAPTGPLTFNGGTLQFDNSFDLSPSRVITLNAANGGFAGGGTFDTHGFTTTATQSILGAGALTKAGAGTLVLTSDNSYSGGTTVASGILQLGNGGTTGSIVGDVADNGTLAFNRSDAVTFPGLISGSGAVTQIGSGTTILTNDNSYSGGTTIAAGTLQVGNGGATGSVGTGPVLDDGALVFNRSGTVAVPGAITGIGSLTQEGVAGGTLVLTGSNTYSGGTTIASGILQLGNGGTTGSIVGDVADNGTLAFDRSDAVTFPGVISGSGAVAQIGSGTTILTNANSYSGGTTIASGILQLGKGGTTGSIVGDVADNGTLAFDRTDAVTFPGVISGSGAVAQIGSGTTILTNANSYSGGTTIASGILQLGKGGTTGSIVGDVADNGTLAFDRTDAVTFPGVISGSGAVTQIGSGTTILTNANSYSGGTTIASGILQLGNGGTTGSIVGDVADNGTLAFDRSDAVTFPGLISGSGTVAQIGTGTTILTADSPYTGRTRVSAGALVVGDLAHPSAALSGGGPITVAHGATLGGYGSVTGSVFNNGVIAAGNATPGFDASPTGTFTIIGNLLNHGLAKLGSDPIIGNVLEVRGAYVGAGGTMAINTFLGGDDSPSDRLVINGGTATGNTAVEVTNVGGPGALTTANGILVVNAINGATTAAGAFTLANDVAAGPFDYRLFQGGVNGGDPGDWFLRNTFEVPPIPPIPPEPPIPPVTPDTPNPPPDPLPPGVYPIIGPRLATDGVVQPIARQIGLTMLGTLHERIGDTLLQESPDGWGRSAWGRIFGDQIDNRYQAFADPSADGRIIGVQAGFDIWRGSLFPGHRDAAGLYFAYGNSASDVNGLVTNPGATGYMNTQTGTLDLNGYSGGAYWTHYGPSGWYLDGVLQGTAYTGTATTAVSSLPTTGSGILISLEGGYPVPLPLGPNFILEPQAQVIWQHVGFSEANDGLTSVDLGSTSGTTGRLGVRGQWTIPGDNGQVWQPYFRANVWRDWGGDASTTFSRVPIAVPLLEQATRLEFGAGITAKVNSSLSFYAQGGYQFAVGDTAGGERQGVSGDLGLRLNW